MTFSRHAGSSAAVRTDNITPQALNEAARQAARPAASPKRGRAGVRRRGEGAGAPWADNQTSNKTFARSLVFRGSPAALSNFPSGFPFRGVKGSWAITCVIREAAGLMHEPAGSCVSSVMPQEIGAHKCGRGLGESADAQDASRRILHGSRAQVRPGPRRERTVSGRIPSDPARIPRASVAGP